MKQNTRISPYARKALLFWKFSSITWSLMQPWHTLQVRYDPHFPAKSPDSQKHFRNPQYRENHFTCTYGSFLSLRSAYPHSFMAFVTCWSIYLPYNFLKITMYTPAMIKWDSPRCWVGRSCRLLQCIRGRSAKGDRHLMFQNKGLWGQWSCISINDAILTAACRLDDHFLFYIFFLLFFIFNYGTIPCLLKRTPSLVNIWSFWAIIIINTLQGGNQAEAKEAAASVYCRMEVKIND